MIKDLIVSFKDSIKQKTTNPFLGTLVTVWLIKNWEFIYTIFNFEDKTTLQDKVAFIKLYLSPGAFFLNLAICIFFAFVSLILTYALLNLSRYIVNRFEKQLTPWVYKMTDESSIVLKTEYNKLSEEKEDLEVKYGNEKIRRRKAEEELEKLESKMSTDSQLLITDEVEYDDEKSKVIELQDYLKKNKLSETFDELARATYLKRYISPNNKADMLILKNLFSIIETQGQGRDDTVIKLELTKTGQILYNYRTRLQNN